jgi:hypothetical protein
MLVLACVADDHDPLPEPGTFRRVCDGEPASLLSPYDYPVEGVCKVCGQPVRVERIYLADWHHIA